jgi:2-haloacid dehalogenase
MDRIKALIFDVFGTLVDWRTSVAREAQSILASLGARIDGYALADAWRDEYKPAMDEVRSGRLPFTPLDVLHRRNLDRVLGRLRLQSVGEDARQRLNLVWQRLDPWPDTTAGLARLRARFRLAPCSNGNIAIMVGLARHNGWVWDAIAGAELARAYKPDSVVYLSAAAALGCAPDEIMMVAAHSYDLAAASALGLRTGFIARPDEFGPGKGEAVASVPVDLSVTSLAALADALGCP